jgi:diguanylate cyclase (GGDEF)-like protein/PAS domain S-box-containing protein
VSGTTEERLRAQIERALRQERALLALAALADQGREERLRHLLQEASRTLEVARVSFWSFRGDPPSIRCDAMYRAATGDFEDGAVLTAVDYPRYFEALGTGTPIVARDAHRDPRTSEFTTGYLAPNGIGAMLDVPVFVRGVLVGVLCHEHVGDQREWTVDEQIFSMAVGQQVSLAIETARRSDAEAALRESERRFRSIVEAAPIPMIVSAYPDGRCLYANEAASRLSGVPLDQMVGRSTPDFYVDPGVREGIVADIQRDGQVSGGEVRLRRADGSVYWALVSIRRLSFDGGPAVIAGFWDMTGQKQLEDRLRHMALHDPLTGLPNRAYFFDLLRGELARARRDPEHKFAVLFIDLDGFKRVNDTLGHDAGDAVLVEVAQRLRACLRETDTAARVGGDEFTVLLVQARDGVQAGLIADRMAAAIGAPIRIGEREATVGASIGIAMGNPMEDDPGDILRHADGAMYRVKEARRAPAR